MTMYANLGGKSNVISFEIHSTSISVLFRGTKKIYTYSYKLAGEYNVENMKILAIQGHGLNSYINRYVKFKYDQ